MVVFRRIVAGLVPGQRKRSERDLDDELRAYLNIAIERGCRRMSRKKQSGRACRVGSLESVKDQTRESVGNPSSRACGATSAMRSGCCAVSPGLQPWPSDACARHRAKRRVLCDRCVLLRPLPFPDGPHSCV